MGNLVTLPGLEPKPLGSGKMHTAATDTIAYLEKMQLLNGSHLLLKQMILDLAVAADNALAAGKITIAATNLIKALQDAMDKLPIQEEISDDVWAQFQKALTGLVPEEAPQVVP